MKYVAYFHHEVIATPENGYGDTPEEATADLLRQIAALVTVVLATDKHRERYERGKA